MQNEELKEHPIYNGYYLDKMGNVYSSRITGRHYKEHGYPRLRKLTMGRNGYWRVALWINGKSKKRMVHQLMLETWVSLRPVGMDALHGSNNKHDNRLENLRWGTRKENNGIDRVRDGTDHRGQKHPMATLTDEQVLNIIRMHKLGIKPIEISRMLSINEFKIYSICSGRSWKYMPR